MNNFLKGILIGVGKIIPGVSGSMIAISLGVYNKMLNSVSNLSNFIKKDYIFLTQICLGILFSIFFLSKVILFFLKNYYLMTMFLFIGLIIGGIPFIIKTTKESTKKINIFFLLLPIIIFYILSLIKFNMNLEINYFNLFIVGLIESITMVVPGLSGTAILMYLGVYDKILLLISNLENINMLLVFSSGVATGIIVLAKLFSYIIEKYKYQTYYFILGLALSTTLIIIKQALQINYSLQELATSILLLIISSLISFKYLN